MTVLGYLCRVGEVAESASAASALVILRRGEASSSQHTVEFVGRLPLVPGWLDQKQRAARRRRLAATLKIAVRARLAHGADFLTGGKVLTAREHGRQKRASDSKASMLDEAPGSGVKQDLDISRLMNTVCKTLQSDLDLVELVCSNPALVRLGLLHQV